MTDSRLADYEAARLFRVQLNRLRTEVSGLSKAECSKKSAHIARSGVYAALNASGSQLPSWEACKAIIQVLLEEKDLGEEATQSHVNAWHEYHSACKAGRLAVSPLRELGIVASRIRPRALAASGLPETLNRLYPSYPLVDLWGQRMPITVFPCPPGQRTQLDAVLGTLSGELPAPYHYPGALDPAGRDTFERLIAKQAALPLGEESHLFSGPTYSLERLRFGSDGAPTLDCRPGRYFSALSSCEDLDHELMVATAQQPHRPIPLDELPRRQWLHEHVPDPVMDGSLRDGAISHATVTMLANDTGGYDVVLPSRSAGVATHAHFRHVAPSGIFSPHTEDPLGVQREYSIMRNFLREWLEEMYDKDEQVRETDYFANPDPAQSEIAQVLLRMLETGDATLTYTGISVNLLMLRPEICLLLRIQNPSLLQQITPLGPFKFGWEYARSATEIDPRDSEQGVHWRLQLGPDLRPKSEDRLLSSHLVPNAAAALLLALTALNPRSPA